ALRPAAGAGAGDEDRVRQPRRAQETRRRARGHRSFDRRGAGGQITRLSYSSAGAPPPALARSACLILPTSNFLADSSILPNVASNAARGAFFPPLAT